MNPVLEALRNFCYDKKIMTIGSTVRNLTGQRIEFPALCYDPVQLIDKAGTDEGTLKYKIKFTLLEKNQNYTDDEKEEVFYSMEKTILELIGFIAGHSRIVGTNLVSSEPSESNYTHYGELSVCVILECDTWYCNELY